MSRASANVRVAARFLTGSYFNVGDVILYGRWKNHVGRITAFGADQYGNPTVTIEPVPLGRKKPKTFGLFKIWRKDVKDKALAERTEQSAAGGAVAAAPFMTVDDDDEEDDDDAEVRDQLESFRAVLKTASEKPRETAMEFAKGFYSRHPQLRRYAPSKVLDKTYGGSSGHGEARQHGSEIWLFPKFWALPADVQDFVFAHEIGHYVLSEYGLSKFSREAEAAGVDVWDNLPFGQFNQDEAFAEVFATYFLTPSELRSRYPEWVPLVEGVAKTANMNPKPPSKSQIDYAKRLLQQVGADEPDWDRLDGVEVSTLIDALKKRRGKPVWYGNGQFSHWEKESGIRVVLATRGMSWEKASGTKVVITTGGMSWGHARMMLRVAARYKEKKTVKTQEGKERTVYVYSERQIALRNAEKARKVEKIKSSIGKLRSKLKKDIRSEDPEKKLTALAVGLLDETFERVGNDDSAAERGHFGVTGWQKKHLSFGKGGVSISYTGKSGVKHKKTVSDDMIKKALRDAYEAVEDDDACIFEWEGGKVSAEKVNAYLEPFGVTAKDIRGFHANDQMASKLREARKAGGELPTDKKEKTKLLKAEFKKALEETAEAVGHEAATLRSQYLIPGIEEQYTKSGTILDKVASALVEAEDARWMLAHSVVFRYLSRL